MDLQTLWFAAVAVLWTGFLLLEGFDFGVAALLPVLGRDRADGAQHQVPVGGPPTEHRQQRRDAEVEALQQQEAGPQHRDGGEPQGLQVHLRSSWSAI